METEIFNDLLSDNQTRYRITGSPTYLLAAFCIHAQAGRDQAHIKIPAEIALKLSAGFIQYLNSGMNGRKRILLEEALGITPEHKLESESRILRDEKIIWVHRYRYLFGLNVKDSVTAVYRKYAAACKQSGVELANHGKPYSLDAFYQDYKDHSRQYKAWVAEIEATGIRPTPERQEGELLKLSNLAEWDAGLERFVKQRIRK